MRGIPTLCYSPQLGDNQRSKNLASASYADFYRVHAVLCGMLFAADAHMENSIRIYSAHQGDMDEIKVVYS